MDAAALDRVIDYFLSALTAFALVCVIIAACVWITGVVAGLLGKERD